MSKSPNPGSGLFSWHGIFDVISPHHGSAVTEKRETGTFVRNVPKDFGILF